jgi:hypothetical protein
MHRNQHPGDWDQFRQVFEATTDSSSLSCYAPIQLLARSSNEKDEAHGDGRLVRSLRTIRRRSYCSDILKHGLPTEISLSKSSWTTKPISISYGVSAADTTWHLKLKSPPKAYPTLRAFSLQLSLSQLTNAKAALHGRRLSWSDDQPATNSTPCRPGSPRAP